MGADEDVAPVAPQGKRDAEAPRGGDGDRASALPALVMARGHRVDEVAELPLVVSEGAEGISKTKKAVEFLKKLGLEDELEKVLSSKKLRSGQGKMRNRRYTMRRGPLVVYKENNGIARAFRAIPGVELCSVDRLNLLQLAPGGTFGRLIVWTAPRSRRCRSSSAPTPAPRRRRRATTSCAR